MGHIIWSDIVFGNERDFRDLEAGDLGVINGVDNLTKMPNGNLLTNAHRPKWNSELTFLQIINPLYYPAGQIGKYHPHNM